MMQSKRQAMPHPRHRMPRRRLTQVHIQRLLHHLKACAHSSPLPVDGSVFLSASRLMKAMLQNPAS